MTPYQEKIYNNPFRILGVYANASIKDVKANEAKAKAFLNVGKDVTFPCDFNQIMPLLERTPEMMESANAQLTLPNEKIKYALLWFVKATPLDEIAFNHLENGNFEQTLNIWRKKECFSSLLNISTLALIHGHYLLAVDSIIKMLESEKHRQDFISSVVDETFQISAEELVHSFLDVLIPDSTHSLLESSTLSDTYKEYIKNKVIKPIIDDVEIEITKAKSIKRENSSARYNAGIRLIHLAKSKLAELKKLLVGNDMHYQIIADKLGLEILQCGIDYYNNSDDVDAAHKTMKLQGYAQSVVVGQMAKDRCKQNTDILKKIIAELPPIEILSEDDEIKKELAFFCLLPCSIDSSNDLMRNCTPYIIDIKEKLGKLHKYYLKVSTQIVQNALHNVIEEVNRFIEEFNNSIIHSRAELNETLKKAWLATLNMGIFDMEESFKNERFLSQKDALRNILQSARIEVASMVATIDLRTEEEVYNSCVSIRDYHAYIKNYPNGKFVSQANYTIELKTFKSCRTKAQYQNYIDRYPDGRYVQQAILKRDELHLIEEENKRKETAFYNSCSIKDDFERYLKLYPNGIFAEQAKNNIYKINLEKETEFFNSCSSVADYISYLQQYPLGLFRAKARTAINRIKQQEERDYYNKCSTILELRDYISKYPYGMYLDEANVRIKNKELRRNIILWIFIIGLAIAAFIYFTKDRDLKAFNNLLERPTIEKCQDFIERYPQSIKVNEAKKLIEKKYEEELFDAKDSSSLAKFISKYSAESKYVRSIYKEEYKKKYIEMARKSLKAEKERLKKEREERQKLEMKEWSTENRAWKKASQGGTLDLYNKYLSLYPNGAHSVQAKQKIIDLEVSDVFASGDYGQLPSMDRTGYSNSTYSTVSVRNDTQYTLTLLYSGAESKRLVISPHSSKSVSLKSGSYRIVASVDAYNVRNFAGREELMGGSYDVSYYIQTSRY